MKFAYVQIDQPIPFSQIALVANSISDHGWEFVEAIYFSLAVPKQTLALSNSQKPAPIPMYILLFRKSYNEGEEIPRFPEKGIVIGPKNPEVDGDNEQ